MASFAERYPMPINLASAFSPSEADEMRDNFAKFDENNDGSIDSHELANILGIAGDAVTPELIGALLGEADTNNDGKISFDEYVHMMYKTKKSGVQTQLSTVIKRAAGIVQTVGAGGATHTFSEEEKVAFATHINHCCANDPLVARHIPINPDNYELFSKCHDGLIFCRLINLAAPQTIDERALNKKSILSVYQKIENLNIALNAAKSIGCQIVNIGAQDLIESRPILMLGLLWQIIKIQLLSMISLKNHPELVLLLEPGEDLASFMKLPPEEILMRWVNYHLKRANSPRRMTNFTSDIKDSVIYSTLTNQLDASKCTPINVNDPPLNRAAVVIRNANALGASPFLQPRDIVDGNKKLNIGYVAQLFNACPGLYFEEGQKPDLSDLDIDDAGDSREERVFRMWMNSLNIEDMYINNLFYDLQDGVNLLKVFDRVQPGSVNWKRVNMKPATVFKRVENCNYATQIAKNDFKFSMVNIGGTDIESGNKKLILAIIWQTMRKYTLQVLSDLAHSQGLAQGDFNEDHIVAWANQTVANAGKHTRMKNLRDPSLQNSLFFLDLVHAIEPRAVEQECIIMHPQPCVISNNVNNNFLSDDCMTNARYVITCARKIGACVFLTPEDICEVKAKMLLTFVAGVWQAELIRKGAFVANAGDGMGASPIKRAAAPTKKPWEK